MPKKPRESDPDRLVRESAGSYASEDGRFRVRSDSGGAWYVADTARVNELGLELVIGPLPTIAAAREALARQRAEPTGLAPEDLPEPTPAKKSAGTQHAGRDEPASVAATAQRVAEPPHRPKPVVRRAAWERTGDERDAVADAFRRINDAWTDGAPERMAEMLDERIVMVQPGFAVRVDGRDAAIASFRDFMESAAVHEYAETDLVIHVAGATAVVTCLWEMDWEYGPDERAAADPSARRRERGHDVYVFTRERGRWRAVWRVLIPESA